MKDFPEFMNNEVNLINPDKQNTKDVKGYFFQGADDSQMAYWTSSSDRVSKKHTHDFDEYLVCVHGQYIVYFKNDEFILNQGDELFIQFVSGKYHYKTSCIKGSDFH